MAEVHARTAVAAVCVSPTKPKGKGRLEATENYAGGACSGRSIVCKYVHVMRMNNVSSKVSCALCGCSACLKSIRDQKKNVRAGRARLSGLTRNEGSTKWKGA